MLLYEFSPTPIHEKQNDTVVLSRSTSEYTVKKGLRSRFSTSFACLLKSAMYCPPKCIMCSLSGSSKGIQHGLVYLLK